MSRARIATTVVCCRGGCLVSTRFTDALHGVLATVVTACLVLLPSHCSGQLPITSLEVTPTHAPTEGSAWQGAGPTQWWMDHFTSQVGVLLVDGPDVWVVVGAGVGTAVWVVVGAAVWVVVGAGVGTAGDLLESSSSVSSALPMSELPLLDPLPLLESSSSPLVVSSSSPRSPQGRFVQRGQWL